MKILSVVCARAGSKGMKNKCIARIRDKMVIEYSIEYSLSLGKDVKTVVSTDIPDAIDYCKANDIEYIKRHPTLCEDAASIYDVLTDAIEKKGEGCVYCSLVYGNIPIRYPELFHEASKFLEDHPDYTAAISMQDVGKFHPKWMFDYNDDHLPKKNIKDKYYRRQMLPPKMIHDAHTLIFKIEGFLKRHKKLVAYDRERMYSVYGDRIKPFISDELIIDIDTENDLKIARALIASGEI